MNYSRFQFYIKRHINSVKYLNISILFIVLIMISSSLYANISVQFQANIDRCKSLEDDNPDQAIGYANGILHSIDQVIYPSYFGQITGCLGWALAMNNQPDLSRISAENLEKLTNKLENSRDKSTLYMRAGGIFHILGDRISASSNYNKAYDVADSLNIKKELIPILVNLGVINSELKEHKTAIVNYNYALELMQEINDFRYKPPVLFNLALTLLGQKMFEQGLEMFLQIELMIDDNWPKGRVSQVYSGLASSYMGLENYPLAKKYNKKTRELQDETGVLDSVRIMTEVAHAKILQKMGEDKEAKEFAQKAYDYYMNSNEEDITYGSNGLNILASIFEEYGDFVKSVDIYKLNMHLYNKFQESFNKESIAQMQARLINGQQREELLDLKHKNAIEKLKIEQQQEKNNRESIIAIVFVAILLMFLTWMRVMNVRLKRISLRDSLTKLGNRRALKQWFDRNPKKPKLNRFLCLLDLDKFKRINDHYGHDAGDEVLINISRCLANLKNSDNFVGRWGGEEFIIITDDFNVETVYIYLNDLLKNIAKLNCRIGNQNVQITASIGVSEIKDDTKSAWDMSLSQADKALYKAKDAGRNRFEIFAISKRSPVFEVLTKNKI